MEEETLQEHLINLKKYKLPPISEIKDIVVAATEILQTEQKVIMLNPPISIVGNIHGHFSDLEKIFHIGGSPFYTRYLFLGNYVDKGNFSLNVLLYLLIYKILYPKRIYLLRGGHESCTLNKLFNFYKECLQKTITKDVWKAILNLYKFLPLAAIINKAQIFCIHGGLSPEIDNIMAIENIERKEDVNTDSVLADLLWSDPNPNINKTVWDFSANGFGYFFPHKETEKFLKANNMKVLIRSREIIEEGVKESHCGLVITINSTTKLSPSRLGGYVMVGENFGIEPVIISNKGTNKDDYYISDDINAIWS